VRYKNPTPNPLPASEEGAYDVYDVYSKRLEAGLFYHTRNKVQSLSPLRGEVWRGVSYLVKL
jgi:hypothetical protein